MMGEPTTDQEYPLTSKSGKRYREEERDGDTLRIYESGVIQRWNEDKQLWTLAPGTAKHTITSEDASELALTRWEKVREAAIEGASEATGGNSEPEAVRIFVRELTKHALAGGRGGSAYAKQVRELAGWERPQLSKASWQDEHGNKGSVETENVGELLRIVQLRRQAQADG